jgi:hypothetical protein
MAAIQEHLLRYRNAPEAAAHEVDFDDQLGDAKDIAETSAVMAV